ncbi:MAG: phosphohistidine phosphatase SixA [Candidatus Acidiferrales bacterium]
MLLYLMRHGIAIDRDDPNAPPEAERHLTPKGVEKTREAARGLRALGVKPRTVLSSPYLRALQTAEIVCEELDLSLSKLRRTPELLPEAAAADFFRALRKLHAEEVICFGHAPNMDHLIAHALGAAHPVTVLKKAGVACVELQAPGARRGTLQWVVTPKMLRKMN